MSFKAITVIFYDAGRKQDVNGRTRMTNTSQLSRARSSAYVRKMCGTEEGAADGVVTWRACVMMDGHLCCTSVREHALLHIGDLTGPEGGSSAVSSVVDKE